MSAIERRALLAATAAVLAATATASAQTTPPAADAAVTALPDPAQRKGETVELNGARIFYSKMGQGSPVMLVHGYPLSGALFGRVAATLAQKHTLILPDLRGYGLSHAPGITGSVEVYADDMLALMAKLGIDKAAIGGMSMGGPTVLAMLKKAPEKFSALALIDTNFKKASPVEAGLWTGLASMAESTGNAEVIPFLLPNMLTGKTRADDMAQVAYLTSVMKQASREALVSGCRVLASRPDATDLLATIKVPTLVLVGQDDPVYPVELATAMQLAIKGAQLHVVPGASHAAVFEMPQDAGAALAAWAG